MSTPLKKIADWLDDRSGVRQLIHEALYERVPGGARWRYVWGSTLVMAFVTQAITGAFLWMSYSPSTQTAWESVFYIEYEMTAGWLLRGIHHFMAQAMVVLLGIHFIQVVWDGAYRAPRELNFVSGMLLALVVLGLSFTGYLLPWDQKGYWATNVGTELASQAPIAGAALKKLAVGGSGYGHQTLTRFFALHAGVLPGLLVGLLMLHLGLFRRHGLHAKDPQHAPDTMFWPDQVLKDSVAALAVLVVVLALTIWKGAELTAPADPANPYNAARPEWYFLFLFQFLKWFKGAMEVWGAFVIPGLIVAYLFLMPWIGRNRSGHLFNVAMLLVLFGGVGLLTYQAIRDDNYAAWTDEATADPERFQASQNFLVAKHEAHHAAQRVIELARSPERIPATGALTLVHDDPYLQGPKLFKQHCTGCHSYVDQEHPDAAENIVSSAPSAPNLFGVGSRRWILGMLDPKQVATEHYFGYQNSPYVGEGDYTDMVDFVLEAYDEEMDADAKRQVDEAFEKVAAALSAEAQLPGQAELDRRDQETIDAGRALMEGDLADVVANGMSCTDCHSFGEMQEVGSPELDGYMSRQWLMDFIRNPAHESFYGEMNDRMPAFAPHDDSRLNQLDDKSIGLIVDWLRGDWYRAESASTAE